MVSIFISSMKREKIFGSSTAKMTSSNRKKIKTKFEIDLFSSFSSLNFFIAPTIRTRPDYRCSFSFSSPSPTKNSFLQSKRKTKDFVSSENIRTRNFQNIFVVLFIVQFRIQIPFPSDSDQTRSVDTSDNWWRQLHQRTRLTHYFLYGIRSDNFESDCSTEQKDKLLQGSLFILITKFR